MKNLLSKVNPALGDFSVHPNGWMKAFGINEQSEINSVNKLIHDRIGELHLEYQAAKSSFMGRAKLENQGIDFLYSPNRTGRKMWCLSDNQEVRRRYINYVKNLCEEANEIYQRILGGDFS